jgi:hypothetical protein
MRYTEGVELTMLTVIAEIRTRPGQHHQAVLDQFAKITPTVLRKRAATAMRRWWITPLASVSDYFTGFHRDGRAVGKRRAS